MATPDDDLVREPSSSEPSSEDAPDGFLERAWRSLSRWAVPVMMTLAYLLLAATSDTDATGKAWMAAGLGLVLIVWFVFRSLTETAALARAFAVGDTARLFALADRQLARRRRPADRARFLVARAFAHQLRGQLTAALTTLADAQPDRELEPLARVIRLAALIDLGRPVDAGARAAASGAPASRAAASAPALHWLADAQLAWADGQLDTASQLLARIVEDIRAGSATRAIAHLYAARIAAARGETAVADRHRAEAAALATSGATWLRGPAASDR